MREASNVMRARIPSEVCSAWRKTVMVKPEDALTGRAEAMPVAPKHLVLGTPMAPPFPEGLDTAVFGMGCFWGAERKFWQVKGVYTTAVGYAGGFTPNPTYDEVCSGLTGHTEAVLVVFDRRPCHSTSCSRCSGRATTRRRACARATTPARSTARRSTAGPRRSGRPPQRQPRRLPGAADHGRVRANHDRDRPGRRVLLRRGLPPAVPREEPERVLRPRRHRRGCPAGLV